MKKITALMTALAVSACMQVSTAFASESPTCVLMKFTDDTRFDRIESAATLSDLVMEKLLMSGVFNFKETKVVPADLEQKLYDERAEEFANVKWSMYYGNFTPLFEGDGFNENKAQSIATASVGQYVTPWIIRSIGQTNGADYLIQGTIINIGTGNWMNTKIQNIVNGVNQASALLGSTAAMNLMGALGPLASLAGGFDVKEGGIGVQADLRVIKASNGEVVWHKSVIGKKVSKEIGLGGGLVKIGSDKLNAEMYYKAMDDTAQLITDALVADYNAGKLFVK